MKEGLLLIGIGASLLLNANTFTFKDSEWRGISAGIDAGTTGIGVSFVKQIQKGEKKWGVRVGYHKYTKNYTTDIDDTHYDFDLNLEDIECMLDYHPFGGSFKITFGALFNGNDLEGKITPSGQVIEINGERYQINEVGYVDTTVDYDNDVTPYLGIGWDTSFYKPKNSFGFTFNLGVFYTGSPVVSYTPHYGSAITPERKKQLQKDLEEARKDLQDDLDDYKYFPYISIGFNYKFN